MTRDYTAEMVRVELAICLPYVSYIDHITSYCWCRYIALVVPHSDPLLGQQVCGARPHDFAYIDSMLLCSHRLQPPASW